LWLLNSARNILELKKSSLAKQVSSSGLLQGVLSVWSNFFAPTLFPVMISTIAASDTRVWLLHRGTDVVGYRANLWLRSSIR
jgi:hypothetical protein